MNESIQLDFNSLPSWASKLAVFDLETTGLDLRAARIVTAATAELDQHGTILPGSKEWLINPGIPIPVEASNVHGVTTELAIENGQDPKSAIEEILESIRSYFDQGIPVVAYNAPYDFTILHFEALRHNLEPLQNPGPILDPLVIDKFVDQYRKGKRTLEVSCSTYGVELGVAHNASADAVAAGRLMQEIASRHFEKLPADLDALHNAQIKWSENQDASYEEFRRRTQKEFVVTRGWPLKL